MGAALEPLAEGALYRACEARALPFDTTAELEELELPLGQERAGAALELGAGMRGPGYHVFVLGPPGVGKRTAVARVIGRRASAEPPASDWCYLNDFGNPQRPRALRLPAGRAASFKRDVDRLVEDLRAAIPAVFEGEDYRTRLHLLEKQLEEEREAPMRALQHRAEERQVTVVRTPVGFMVAPVRGGEVVDAEEFRKLPEEEQRRLQEAIAAIQGELQEALRGMPRLDRRHRERVRELNREVALYAVGHLLDELRARWADLPEAVAHLEAVQADVVENVHDFIGGTDGEDAASQMRKLFSETPALRRYGVNVIVDHGNERGAPLVHEDLPTYANLFGRIEHHAHFGTLVTDFTLVRPGALHRANGGYLVLDARRLLSQPFAWEQLKRALEAREIRIDPPERLFGFSSGASLEPEPIPLSVKVVLVGERFLHHLLSALDPEFPAHFQVAAEFDDEIPREGNELAFARLVATLGRAAGLRPLSRAAVARVVEHAARLAEDAERLTARVQAIADLLREADHGAAVAGREVVAPEDVQAAIDARARRHGRVRERLLEEIARGTVLIDTDGERVAQVNGLSVVQAGALPFGRPSRITARVRLGKGEVVDIERQVELGGPIHSKGVLILGGFLSSRFAADRPFPLSATLVFEQSYGGVEGDSASAAELCALLSALSGLPVRQAVAATGSVNQHGEIQAVGGVNEKIEGFFDVCRGRGLTGAQGVIVPRANVKHLMLREDVVRACAEGKFRVWAVDHVDQAVEILTGVPAGARGADGTYPGGSVNARVSARLGELIEKARAFAAERRAEEGPP
ncbi:MAG TPA: ATP-binding protein [Anaeromyxobacteraceae bacterium]|jgi:lon-related putative ATP-dependent protease